MRHLEGQEHIRNKKIKKKKEKAIKMSKSKRLENGKSDLTEAKAQVLALSHVLRKIAEITEKFVLASATWRKCVGIWKTSVVFACPAYLPFSFDNRTFISL